MDTSKNKFAKGQERSTTDIVLIVQNNLSKDGRTLDLTAAHLREYGAKDISNFEPLGELNCLELGSNLIGPGGVKYLARSEVLTNLTSLNLSYNKLGNEGVKLIALSDNLQSLQNLNLSDNNIGEEGAQTLAKFLPLFENLIRLDLRLNYFKEEGKTALREAQKLTKVKQLLLDKEEGFQVKAQ